MGMKVRSTIGPEHRRARKLRQCYGEQLVYVRYRYDEERKRRYTTVELIIDEAEWEPHPKGIPSRKEIVGVRIELKERELQKRIKRAGGLWNQERMLWELRYERAVELGMQDRVVRLLEAE